ncbi:MAG: HNH endonuclease [Alphaproteobacteria bacterium]|nr:HNH endonuclease [Alphaproteobacteria bacterium]
MDFFDNDDPGYSAWLARHPGGFVANMTRTKRSTYFVVHRSSCKTITPGSSRNNLPGAFTARSYRKAASEDLGDLVAWGEQQGFSDDGIRACQVCLAGVPLPTGAGRLFPDEVPVAMGKHREGAVRQVMVNSYERSAAARRACLDTHGHRCAACKLDMGELYGELGEGFIHVHHLVEIATVGEEYEVDPVEDLVPVCPNCHALLHRRTPALTLAELKAVIKWVGSEGSQTRG